MASNINKRISKKQYNYNIVHYINSRGREEESYRTDSPMDWFKFIAFEYASEEQLKIFMKFITQKQRYYW